MKGISIIRDDGLRGTVVDVQDDGIVIDFQDGTSSTIKPETLVQQDDGSYMISSGVLEGEMVIPLLQEEFSVETEKVERAKVKVNKRIETREEVVYTPTTTEEVVVVHVPINQLIEKNIPKVRKENGVLIIPVVEEIVVVEKRLLFKEEVHISKRQTTTNVPQTVVLRREVVDIERTEVDNIETTTDEDTNLQEYENINNSSS